MRVLIDARKLDDGGIGTYLDVLLEGLASVRSIRVGALVSSIRAAAARSWAANVRLIEDPTSQYSFRELVLPLRRIPIREFDLLHVPHYTLPFGVPIPTVVTIHDVIHLDAPSNRILPWIARPLIGSALARATKVITVSSASKEALERRFGSVAHGITVIHNTLHPRLFKAARESGESRMPRTFISIFSNAKPHKGAEDLLAAFRLVREEFSDAELAVIGYGAGGVSKMLESAPSLRKNVRVVGPVTEQELYRWYRCAGALVVPSLAEGFCLPALEAQAFETRVVYRPLPAVSEFASPRDIVAKGWSIEQLAVAMKAAISGPTAALYQQKIGTSADFASMAQDTINVYEEALKKS